MLYWTEYTGHNVILSGKGRNAFDTTIYTFDIETTSLILYNGEFYSAVYYDKLTDKEKEVAEPYSLMYIWQLGINDIVYYGRTYDELIDFLLKIEEFSPRKKYFFIHNLSFEFQFIRHRIRFSQVTARKKRKPFRAILQDFNIEMRCSYIMSNVALAELPRMFKLPVKKMVGDLDYTIIRHSKTPLTQEELRYCEYDCLVVYYYILEELKTYKTVKNIPLTSTGHVRRELQERVAKDYGYKKTMFNCINADGHIYNLLVETFAGGYTHANWVYTDEVLNNIKSKDETSAYPYVMCVEKFPMTEFTPCKIKSIDDLIQDFAYLLVVKFTNIKSKYYNNFISKSKCRNIKGGIYDNGRVIKADEIEIVLTDIDFKLFNRTYDIEETTIIESYYSVYRRLPKVFIDFILEKYVNKTQFKNVSGKELEYVKEKNKFNALYGMAVTNTIRDETCYDNLYGWKDDIKLTNEEILDKLANEKMKGFLSFSTGVWVTAYARRNLIENIIPQDEYNVYDDTDSIKATDKFDDNLLEEYNKSVMDKLKKASKDLDIPLERFMPKDKKGIEHPLGVFETDGVYTEFITQGAKKYCYREYKPIYGFKKNFYFKEENKLHITVAGVPKCGVKALNNDINNFKDNLVFPFSITNKNTVYYLDKQHDFDLTDYTGITEHIEQRTAIALLPATYTLGKSDDYTSLLESDTTERAKFRE